MENRINKVVELKDGRKMFVVNQANYRNRMFFLANELINEDTTDNFLILEEIKENGTIYVEEVTDVEILEKVLAAFEGAL